MNASIRRPKAARILRWSLPVLALLIAGGCPAVWPPSLLQVDAGPDHFLLPGNSTTLAGTARGGMPPYQYAWTPADGLDDPTIARPAAVPAATTVYALTVTDSNGDTAADSVTVTIGPATRGISQENDEATLAALRAEIDTLTADRTCSDGNDCAVMAFGDKVCGGFTVAVVYSRATVDETTLTARAQEFTELQEFMNERYEINSDCSVMIEPASAQCESGMCVAGGTR